MNNYLKIKEPNDKNILEFLYKILLFIENIDPTFILPTLNNPNYRNELLDKLNDLLEKIYQNHNEKIKILISSIVIMGWEYFNPSLKAQINWFEKIKNVSNEKMIIEGININSTKTNIYGIITKNYNPFAVLLNHIFRIYRGKYFPLSFTKANNIKLYLLTEDNNTIYGVTFTTTINSYSYQTPFYYLLLNNEKMEKEIKNLSDNIKLNIYQNNYNPKDKLFGANDSLLSKVAKSLAIEISKKKDNKYNSYENEWINISLEQIFQITGYKINSVLKNNYLNEPKINYSEELKSICKENREYFKFYISMEYSLLSYLNELGKIIVDNKLKSQINNNIQNCINDIISADEILIAEVNEEEEEKEIFLDDKKEHLENDKETKKLTFDFLSEFIDILINKYKEDFSSTHKEDLVLYRQNIIFNYIVNKIQTLQFPKLLFVYDFLSKLPNKENNIKTISSPGYQIENEKIFEYTINQGEYIKINEIASFPNSLCIIVEFDFKCSIENKPNFNILLLSKEHSYNQTNTNNNNVGNYGSCFTMKLNSINPGKKYTLLGDEIKIISHPDTYYRERNNKNLEVKNIGKCLLKIKCYSFKLREYVSVDDKNNVHCIKDNFKKYKLSYMNEIDYYNTLISKILLRSIPQSPDEKLIKKDSNLNFITKFGLSNPGTPKNIINQFNYETYSKGINSPIFKSLISSMTIKYNDKLNETISNIKKAISFIEKNEIENAEKELSYLSEIKNIIRKEVNEPRNYTNLKIIPSFNNKMKLLWNICEYLYMITLFYFLNVFDDFLKIKENKPNYLEYIGKKMNIIISWMTGRVQYLKDTFDNIKNYTEIIVDMNNKCVNNMRELIIDNIKAFLNEQSEDVKEGKEEEEKKKEKEKKVKKSKKEILLKKFATKDSNYKKKNVNRLYVAVDKIKKLKKEKMKKKMKKKKKKMKKKKKKALK
jgi:hypothetical protein